MAAESGRRVTAPANSVLTDYLARIERGDLLTAEQERQLTRAARRGCARSRATLVEKNLRLVVSVAKNYRGRGVPFEDLIQDGNAGLVRAADGFDPERGHRFSTYATWWIRQGVQRGVRDRGRAIRLPVHMGDRVARVHAVTSAMTTKLGRDPTPEELAERLGWKTEKVLDALSVPPEPASLQQAVGPAEERERAELGSLVPDASAEASPEETVLEKVDAEHARRDAHTILSRLEEIDRKILALRHGLDGGEPRDLGEIAEAVGLSRERVRQRLSRALDLAQRTAVAAT